MRFFYCCILGLVWFLENSYPCKANEFSILEGGKTYVCDQFSVKGPKLICNYERAFFIFEKKDVKTVFYKNTPIYPYEFNEHALLVAIRDKKCQDIVKQLYGMLYIDKDKKSNMYLGLMHDTGSCVAKDIDKALGLFLDSGQPENSAIAKRISEIQRLKAIEAEIVRKEEENRILEIKRRVEEKRIQEEELLEEKRKQEEKVRIETEKKRAEARAEEDRRRKMEEKLRPVCEKDCATNKYQFDKSCYDACMRHHGA